MAAHRRRKRAETRKQAAPITWREWLRQERSDAELLCTDADLTDPERIGGSTPNNVIFCHILSQHVEKQDVSELIEATLYHSVGELEKNSKPDGLCVNL